MSRRRQRLLEAVPANIRLREALVLVERANLGTVVAKSCSDEVTVRLFALPGRSWTLKVTRHDAGLPLVSAMRQALRAQGRHGGGQEGQDPNG